MFRFSLAILIALVSFSAFSKVSMEEKRTRVRFLERISLAIPALHIEGYQRELNYEEQGLSLQDRADNEAQLMAQKIKQQVVSSYEKAFAASSDQEEAKLSVRESIDRDLELAEPGIRESIQEIAYKALEDVASGIISSESNDDPLQRYMLAEVKERSSFLNVESISSSNGAASSSRGGSNDAERRSFRNKAEILESLTSDRDNTRWVIAASVTTNSSVTRRADANISYTLKINFLGADLSGGPNIAFHRHYESKVIILSEGLNPPMTANGNFDFNKKNRAGEVVTVGGKTEKRYMSFFCETALNFNTEYSGSGDFSIVGVGGGASFGSKYSNEVTMTSRRILVPEYIGNQSVTLPYLQRLCLNDFLDAKISGQMTVKQSLNIQMRNTVASLRFSHPQTKCVRDTQCQRWFNQSMKAVVGNTAIPRCVEEPREKYFACAVRSVRGQKCPVFKQGKHVSSGSFEYPCDHGMYCKTVKEGGWFQSIKVFEYAEGRCEVKR